MQIFLHRLMQVLSTMKNLKLRLTLTFPKNPMSVLLILCSTLLTAQKNAIISGKIIDKASGETLIGAVIQLDSTSYGAITDINGNYRIAAEPGNYVMTIRYFGFEPVHIETDLKAGKVINMDYAMAEASALSLQEIVVVANAERSSNVVMNIELIKAPI